MHSNTIDKSLDWRGVLLEKLRDGVLIINSRNCIEELNPAAEKLFGAARGQDIATALHAFPELLARLDERVELEAEITVQAEMPRTFDAQISHLPDGRMVVLREITGRKRTEHSLQRFQLVLEHMYSSVLLVTDDERVEFANRAMCDDFGLDDKPADLVGLTAPQVITKIKEAYDEPDRAIAHIRELVGQKQPVRGEELAMRDGRTLLRDFIPLVLDGKSYGRLWLHHDITKRKRAEDALRASQERFRLVLENSLDVIYCLNIRTNRLEYISPSAEAVAGYTQDELMTMDYESALAMIHPDDLPVMRAALVELQATGKAKAEYRQRTRRGEYRWLSNHMSLANGANGEPLYRNGNIRDITERKENEQSIRRLNADLEKQVQVRTGELVTVIQYLRDEIALHTQAEEQLRGWAHVFEHAAWGIAKSSQDGKTLAMANPMFARMHGYEVGELVGVPIVDLFAPQARAEMWEQLRIAHEKGHHTFESEHLRKDKSTFPVQIDVTAVRDAEGSFLYRAVHVQDITERKRTEEALRESEAHFRGYFELGLIGMAITSLEKGWLQFNDRLCEILGYAREELEQKTWAEITHPDDAAVDVTQFNRVLAGEIDGYTMEKRFLRKDGTIVYADISAKCVRRADGTISHFVGMVQDISERKRAEELIKRQYAELAFYYDNIPVGLAVLGRDLCYLQVNKWMAELNGIPGEAHLGKFIGEILPSFEKMTKAISAEILRTGEPVTGLEFAGETRQSPKVKRVWQVGWYPLKDAANNILGITSMVQDITERKRAEDQVHFQARLLDKVAQAIVVTDPDGTVRYWNKFAETMYGWTSAEAIGKSVVEMTPESEQARTVEIIRQLNRGEAWQGEAVARRKDGTTFPSLVTSTPFVDTQGNFTGVIGVSFDLTERKRIEQALERERHSLARRVEERTAELVSANAELGRANRLKNEFLSNMSHELRTPLTAIINLSESLQEGVYGPIAPEQADMLKLVAESGYHLLNLINDILDLSKIEAGRVELNIDLTNVESVCQAALRIVKQQASLKNHCVTLSLENSIPAFYADERRLKQMLVNLLSNAIKFTPDGGQIGLRVTSDSPDVLCFTVWDTGIGIAADQFDKLFKPFVQIDSSLSREYNGTGLGLALVRQLADLHGGSVGMESEPGSGSRFYIVLPVTPVNRTGDISAIAVSSDNAPRISTAHPINANHAPALRILIAEDNLLNLQIISDYLRACDYQIATAGNGMQVMERAREFKPDVILMDIQMPGMDGLDATRRLRTNPEFAHTRIIAVTALAMPGDRERCLQAGADEYITKPLNLNHLTRTIESLRR